MRIKISKRVVDALPSGQRDQFIWDDELHGFGLKVTPSGKRVFIAQGATRPNAVCPDPVTRSKV